MKIERGGITVLSSVITLVALTGCAPEPNPSPAVPQQAIPVAAPVTLRAAVIAAPPPAKPSEPPPETKQSPEPDLQPLPSACSGETMIKDVKACLPPSAFTKKLCGGIYPEIALGMLAKGTPWTRVWLAGDVDAWNASGGLTHRAKLGFDEEVVILSRHAAASMGGITMSGAAASYDVLRWDGTCVSVMDGEVTTRRPPVPKPAPVPWSRLEETTRRALLVSPKVKATRDALDKACSGVSSPAEKRSCEKADKAFTQAIVDFVRTGATLPPPARRP